MKVSDKGIAALIKHEGVVPGPYRDSVGVWTYGVGHTRAAGNPDPVSMPRGVPADLDEGLREVFNVFAVDLERYADAVRRAVKVPMAQHEFDAAVSFHFNTGAIARATWVKRWNVGDKGGAARGIMAWKKPPEIIPRREDERDLFLHGRYPSGKATVWGVSQSGRVIWKPLRTLSQAQILGLMKRPAQPPAYKPHTDTPKQPTTGFWAAIMALLASFKRKKP